MYFDVKDWQIRYGEWQKSIMTQSISDITIKQNKENINHQDIDDMDSGINIVNTNINNKDNNNEEEEGGGVGLIKPMLGRQEILNNAYEPCRLFFLCNGPIWILSGSLTGIIAARILTNSILLTQPAMSAISLLSLDCNNQYNNFELLD